MSSHSLPGEQGGKQNLPATIAAGLTVGSLSAFAQISFGALLFSGSLSGGMGEGVSHTLLGGVLIGSVMALGGSFPGTVARPHELPVIVLALLAAQLAHRLPSAAPGADVLATVTVLIMVSTAVFGLTALLLGRWGAGNLFRYLPFPVLGGFVAGTGGLLVKGGLTVMLGVSADQLTWSALIDPALLGRWLPGLGFAVLMVVGTRRWPSWRTIPIFMISGIAAFHLLLGLTGGSLGSAMVGGLVPSLPAEMAARSLVPAALAGPVAWREVAASLPDILAVAFLASLGTLLNASAIEVTVRRELDFNRDLQMVGLANLLAALVGSPAGFHSLSSTALPDQMGARGRAVGLLAALVCLAAWLGGPRLLEAIPFAVTGGLLVFLGISLVANWLLDRRSFLSPLENSVLLAILVVTMLAGWVAALVAGLVLALVLFVVDYSRISAVRSLMTGRTRRSHVDRSPARSRLLERYGDSILVICLQGHLFFGTAHILRRTIMERLEVPSASRPHWILLDMRLTSGLDASALYTFQRLAQICESAGIELLFSGLSCDTLRLLLRSGILQGGREGQHWFADLDHGLEFCENELLSLHTVQESKEPLALMEAGELRGQGDQQAFERLLECFEAVSFPAGSTIIWQDQPPGDLILLLSGRVVVERRPTPQGAPMRLRTMDPGTCVGEIGFYLGTPTSASVICEEEVRALRLSQSALAELEKDAPEAAMLLHRLVARKLAQRLISTNQLATALAG
ncbi:SLC26A/SulP transporter family protein [Cyanobium sp. ATX 6A2]|nr:SLC26A/SulP transporter family protein [Cyanobium sp. ATX 6A2]